MKSVRLTSVISMAVFCLLALQVHLTAQELQRHSFADLIQNPDEMQASSDTSTPDSLVATTVKLYPTHLSFGSIAIGNHSFAKTVTLTNVGTSSLTIYGIAITGTDRKDFTQTHTCGPTLARGAICIIKVTFSPTALGTRTAALSIYDNGGSSPQRVTLSGTGIAGQCRQRFQGCSPNLRCCPGLKCVLIPTVLGFRLACL
jgi:HYDIN/CFA65/VesB family protein/ion channel inhibitory toxin